MSPHDMGVQSFPVWIVFFADWAMDSSIPISPEESVHELVGFMLPASGFQAVLPVLDFAVVVDVL